MLYVVWEWCGTDYHLLLDLFLLVSQIQSLSKQGSLLILCPR